MLKKIFVGLGILIFIILACEVKDPLTVTGSPSLSDLNYSEIMYVFQDINYSFSVKVEDPDGLDDIRLAKIKITNESGQIVHEDTLADDGKEGDIIPLDGIYYTNLILDDFNRKPGTYYFSVYAQDLDGNPATPLSDTISVLAGSPPEIVSIQYTDSMDVTLLQDACFEVEVNDEDGLEDIDSVYVAVKYSWNNAPHLLLILNDDGLEGDNTASDGTYTMKADLSNVFTVPTEYELYFVVVDKDGLRITSSKKTLKVDRENNPPQLNGVDAPETATLPQEGDVAIVLKCTAEDPQGLDDIDRVWFDSTKPDGTAASGNPFILYDNGIEGGDEVVGDGIYTLTIYLPVGTTTGTYTFDFQIRDHSGLTGNTIRHELTVVE